MIYRVRMLSLIVGVLWWKDSLLYSLYPECDGTALQSQQCRCQCRENIPALAAHAPIIGRDLELGNWPPGHRGRWSHWATNTTQSDRCQGASLLIIQHTWDTLIGLGFSCDNQGLAACLYLSMAVSQRGVLGSGGRNCLLCWKGPLWLQYLCDGVLSHTHTPGHCSVVPVLSRGPLWLSHTHASVLISMWSPPISVTTTQCDGGCRGCDEAVMTVVTPVYCSDLSCVMILS